MCTVLRIENLADAPVVRAVTLRRGLSAGLDRLRAGEAALVASDLATSMAKYSDGGEIMLDVDLRNGTFWIVALDRGPGLPSLEDYFQEAFDKDDRPTPLRSVSLELGSRVGAVRRLADDVRWEAREGGGSRISCQISLNPGGGPAGRTTESEKSP